MFPKLLKKLFGMTSVSKQVVTRVAPSPTGNLHVGTARTALANYLFARQYNGVFYVRVEDTDKERSTKAFEENILSGLSWLGLNWDNEAIIRQSERTDLYKSYLEKMITAGTAYISEEKVEKEGDRAEVIRFKNPNREITFVDEIRGEITFDTTELGDFVIAKSLEEPLYHLTVVIDDHEMGVTHVIRGEDHISNTPRQILIQEAIGADRPIYAHLPLLLGKDRAKLSKRHGAKSVNDYQAEGYLPEALVNYLALLGWNPGTEEEMFTLQELVDAYTLAGVQKGGAIFDTEKLDWFNAAYIRQLPEDKLQKFFAETFSQIGLKDIDATTLQKATPLIAERIEKFSDIETLYKAGEFTYFFIDPSYDAEGLVWGKAKQPADIPAHLEKITSCVETLDENNFSYDVIKDAVWEYASEQGRGDVLWPFRYALSGQEKSADPFSIAEVIGKTATLSRLATALEKAKTLPHATTEA